MCMACGLITHDGEMKEYARNGENSRPSMRHAYSSGSSGTSSYSQRQAPY
jgi:hypothetical protein